MLLQKRDEFLNIIVLALSFHARQNSLLAARKTCYRCASELLHERVTSDIYADVYRTTGREGLYTVTYLLSNLTTPASYLLNSHAYEQKTILIG